MSAAESEFERLHNHDIKAQIVNIKGFCREIESIISDISTIYSSEDGKAEKLDALLREDLLPFTEYLSISAKKLADLNGGVSSQSVQVNK